MPCRADALLLGVLVAAIMRDERSRALVEGNRRFLGAIILVLIGGCAAMISQAYWSTAVAQTVGYTWIALLYAAFLLYLLTHDSKFLKSVFRSKPLTFLGTIAYGVYLFHQPILLCVASLISPTMSLRDGFPVVDSLRSFATTCAALVLTLVLAQISWKRFEKPLVEIGHRSEY